jgi:hypothetical protein
MDRPTASHASRNPAATQQPAKRTSVHPSRRGISDQQKEAMKIGRELQTDKMQKLTARLKKFMADQEEALGELAAEFDITLQKAKEMIYMSPALHAKKALSVDNAIMMYLGDKHNTGACLSKFTAFHTDFEPRQVSWR